MNPIETKAEWMQWNRSLRKHTWSWLPSNPRGAICILHGLGEHGGRYENLASWFANRGFACLCFDQQGHGLDERNRGCIDSYPSVVQDVVEFVHWTRRQYKLPTFLFGHSMGGNLAINAALRNPDLDVRGIIASSPMLKTSRKIAKWYELLARVVARFAPNHQLNSDIVVSRITDDRTEQELLYEDKLFHACLSLRLAAALIDSGKWAIEHADALTLPLLLTHGDRDFLTCPTASEEFAQRSKTIFHKLPGFLHDTFRCSGKEKVKTIFEHQLNAWTNET